VAANTIAIKIIVFAILPSWGMSNAAATLVGQNLGAGKPERAEKSVWLTGFYNMIFLGAVGLIFIVFAERIIAMFTTDPAVVPLAVSGLRLLSYGYVSYAYGMVVTAAFNGAGDTFTPTILNLVSFWLCQIPLGWLLAFHTSLGAEWSFCLGVSVGFGVGFAFHPVVPARDLEANENLSGGCTDVQSGFG